MTSFWSLILVLRFEYTHDTAIILCFPCATPVPPPPVESPKYAVQSIQPGRPEHNFHALVAGAVGGCFVWGSWSTISHQVLMYISIRVLAGLWKLLPVHDESHWRTTHRLASTVAWAVVMYLWETSPHVLQRSMRKSMEEIYDSRIFKGGRNPSTWHV